MSEALGKKIWAFPDAFLPAKGHPYKTTNHGDQYGHESLCIINYDQNPANIVLDFLYEDQDPIENYTFTFDSIFTFSFLSISFLHMLQHDVVL